MNFEPHVDSTRGEGIILSTKPASHCSTASERFFPALVKRRLANHPFGSRLIHVPSCESTNDVLWVEIERGAPMGTTVVADCQTRGRGRTGKRWESPLGKDLLVSIAAPWDASQPSAGLAVWAAVAVADMLTLQNEMQIELRWPNDLIASGRKLGGVMAETRSGQALAVVGIGINVLSASEDRPAELRDLAVSLYELDRRAWDRSLLLADILNALESWWARLCTEGWAVIYERWCALCSAVGQQVQARCRNEIIAGRLERIDWAGRLVIQREDGELTIISAAEVTSLVPSQELSHNELPGT